MSELTPSRVAVGTNEYAAEVPNELWAAPGAYSLRVVLQGQISITILSLKLPDIFSQFLFASFDSKS